MWILARSVHSVLTPLWEKYLKNDNGFFVEHHVVAGRHGGRSREVAQC